MADMTRLLIQASRCAKCQSKALSAVPPREVLSNAPNRFRTPPMKAHISQRRYLSTSRSFLDTPIVRQQATDSSATSSPPPFSISTTGIKTKAAHPAPSRKSGPEPPKRIIGRVTSAGLMNKTVRVEWRKPIWDNYLRKFYKGTQHVLVHDPASSLLQGDVVSIRPLTGPRSARVAHVVHEILVPFGKEIGERPAVPSEEAYVAQLGEKSAARRERREVRSEAERGDEGARERVEREGWAVRQVVRGKGRSRRVRTVLEREVRAGVRGSVLQDSEGSGVKGPGRGKR